MKLEVGMYVRTRQGIRKINNYAYENMGLIFIDGFPYQTSNVLKSSFNIIDLIEVGDYVNGFKIQKVVVLPDNMDGDKTIGINGFSHHDYDIQEILTHEQYESMVYKI